VRDNHLRAFECSGMVLFLRISLGGFGGEQHDEVK
jgi:hypothetical protein